MSNINICPYCGSKMKLGFIHGDRCSLKWIPEGKDKGIFLQWFVEGIKLGYSIEAFYCGECKKIIIDGENNTSKI